MKKIILTATAVFGMLATQGCAHHLTKQELNQRLDAKVAAETNVKSGKDLRKETSATIDNAPDLTTEQKAKIKQLRETTTVEMEKWRLQSVQLRAVLIKDLMSPNYDQQEVDLLKNKIKTAEHKRLNVLLTSVEQTNEILGRWATRNDRMSAEYFDEMMLYDSYSLH